MWFVQNTQHQIGVIVITDSTTKYKHKHMIYTELYSYIQLTWVCLNMTVQCGFHCETLSTLIALVRFLACMYADVSEKLKRQLTVHSRHLGKQSQFSDYVNYDQELWQMTTLYINGCRINSHIASFISFKHLIFIVQDSHSSAWMSSPCFLDAGKNATTTLFFTHFFHFSSFINSILNLANRTHIL